MKKKILMLLLTLCLTLTGCTISDRGVSFYRVSKDGKMSGTTTLTWSLVIALLVILVFLIVYILLMVKNHMEMNNKNTWEQTTARLTGNMNTYRDSYMRNGYFSFSESKTEYQIEYMVNGKVYVKYITEIEIESSSNGVIKIEYQKKHPSIFRVL